jgi:hypothetical protein
LSPAVELRLCTAAQFEPRRLPVLPGLFTPDETRTLTDAVPALYARREAYNVREKGSDAVRTNFAAHLYSEPFARLARHPRMVEPVQALFGERVYMHQFKINGKMAFEGDVWQWHQDYGTWKNDDLMPTERAMNVAIFLDEVNEFNGPLMFIPGSHRRGVIDARHDLRPPATRCGRSTTNSSRSWWSAPAAGTAASSRRRARRVDDPVPLLPGARLDQQPEPVEPRQRLPEPVRGQQPHPPLQAARSTSRTATSRRSTACPTTACCRTVRWTCRGARHAGQRAGPRPTFSRGPPEGGPMSLYTLLQQPRRRGRPIRVGLIGAGKFGSMYLAQVPRTPGVHLVGIADLSPEAACRNLARVGWEPQRAQASSLDAALRDGNTHVGDDWQALVRHPAIDIVVECTGHPIAAVDHCLEAFAQGKHVVNVTVEADAFCGPLLALKAAEAASSIRWPSATSRR